MPIASTSSAPRKRGRRAPQQADDRAADQARNIASSTGRIKSCAAHRVNATASTASTIDAADERGRAFVGGRLRSGKIQPASVFRGGVLACWRVAPRPPLPPRRWRCRRRTGRRAHPASAALPPSTARNGARGPTRNPRPRRRRMRPGVHAFAPVSISGGRIRRRRAFARLQHAFGLFHLRDQRVEAHGGAHVHAQAPS